MEAFLRKHLSDGLLLAGASLIVTATAMLSWVAGMYVAGALLMALGAAVAWGNGRRA